MRKGSRHFKISVLRLSSFEIFSKPVDHGVVWLTISIEGDLIIPSSTGFFPHELTNTLRAQVGQARKGVSRDNQEGGDVVS